MATTRKRERFIAIFFVGLFIISISSLTIAIAIDQYQRNKQQDSGASSQQQAKTGENMLQGTKLENFTPVADIPQLQAQDIKPGDGAEVKAGDTINFDYTGALAADGTIFQSSLDSGQAVTFPLTSLIKGWQEGIPGMKVGGTRRLLIPSDLGYGSAAQQGIPANSDLVFDITVHKVGE
jgi:FKBP-type peptidyl-prolyl cis-trans isomerase